MTVPHQTRALAPASVPAAITTLRVRGLRVSAARRLVLEALFAADGPVTAEAIAAGLGGRLPGGGAGPAAAIAPRLGRRLPGSDLGSGYRNPHPLGEDGLGRPFPVAHG